MAELILSINKTNRTYRLAVSCLFFLQGLSFASWASRIPSIQQAIGLSDVALGMVLFALPVGSMISVPFSGWLVSKYGSRRVAANALLFYSLFLVFIGLANSVALLVGSLVLFGMVGNVSNIAINTQAVIVESRYKKNIMASLHGLWSLAGFVAAWIGSMMIGEEIMPVNHFLLIAATITAALALTYRYLLPDTDQKSTSTRLFIKPDKTLMRLGIIAFFCMICEGAMFDWSGIYFKKVVEADKSFIGMGYAAFMLSMATGRFISDWAVNKLGFQKTLYLSGSLIATGLLIAIIFPYLVPAITGFLIVGFGVSSVIPLVYSQSGKNSQSPSMALAAVSSIGFLGFLAGPPLIGLVAGFLNLQFAFLLIAFIGIFIVFLARSTKNK